MGKDEYAAAKIENLDSEPRHVPKHLWNIAKEIARVVEDAPGIAKNFRVMFQKAAKLPGVDEWLPGEWYDSGDSVLYIPKDLQGAWIAIVHDFLTHRTHEPILAWECGPERNPSKTICRLRDLARDLIFTSEFIEWTDKRIDDIEKFVAHVLPECTIPHRQQDLRGMDASALTPPSGQGGGYIKSDEPPSIGIPKNIAELGTKITQATGNDRWNIIGLVAKIGRRVSEEVWYQQGYRKVCYDDVCGVEEVEYHEAEKRVLYKGREEFKRQFRIFENDELAFAITELVEPILRKRMTTLRLKRQRKK